MSTRDARPAPGQPGNPNWKKNGPSPNPGGYSKLHREMRKAFLRDVPTARRLLRKWLAGPKPARDGKPAVEVSEAQQMFAVEKTFNRGLGREGKASELPSLRKPKKGAASVSTEELLSETRRLYSASLATLSCQMRGGEVGSDALERLQGLSSGLQSLVRAEEEARRTGSLAGLSTDELVALVAKLLPREALEQMLRTKQAEEGA